VVKYEEGYNSICGCMPDMSESKGGVSKAWWVVAVVRHS